MSRIRVSRCFCSGISFPPRSPGVRIDTGELEKVFFKTEQNAFFHLENITFSWTSARHLTERFKNIYIYLFRTNSWTLTGWEDTLSFGIFLLCLSAKTSKGILLTLKIKHQSLWEMAPAQNVSMQPTANVAHQRRPSGKKTLSERLEFLFRFGPCRLFDHNRWTAALETKNRARTELCRTNPAEVF